PRPAGSNFLGGALSARETGVHEGSCEVGMQQLLLLGADPPCQRRKRFARSKSGPQPLTDLEFLGRVVGANGFEPSNNGFAWNLPDFFFTASDHAVRRAAAAVPKPLFRYFEQPMESRPSSSHRSISFGAGQPCNFILGYGP